MFTVRAYDDKYYDLKWDREGMLHYTDTIYFAFSAKYFLFSLWDSIPKASSVWQEITNYTYTRVNGHWVEEFDSQYAGYTIKITHSKPSATISIAENNRNIMSTYLLRVPDFPPIKESCIIYGMTNKGANPLKTAADTIRALGVLSIDSNARFGNTFQGGEVYADYNVVAFINEQLHYNDATPVTAIANLYLNIDRQGKSILDHATITGVGRSGSFADNELQARLKEAVANLPPMHYPHKWAAYHPEAHTSTIIRVPLHGG